MKSLSRSFGPAILTFTITYVLFAEILFRFRCYSKMSGEEINYLRAYIFMCKCRYMHVYVGLLPVKNGQSIKWEATIEFFWRLENCFHLWCPHSRTFWWRSTYICMYVRNEVSFRHIPSCEESIKVPWLRKILALLSTSTMCVKVTIEVFEVGN